MGQLVIEWRELRDLPLNMIGLSIVKRLIEAGAPIKLKPLGFMIGINRPLTDDDVIVSGPIERCDGWHIKHPASMLFQWGKHYEGEIEE